MVILSSYFPNFDLTDAKIAIWREALFDLSDAQVMDGVKKFCLATKEIYPGTNIIAYIREYALEINEQETAGEAWASVLGAAGGRKTRDWTPPSQLAKRAADCIGGYDHIGYSENSEATRAHFFRVFADLQKRESFNKSIGR